MRCDDSDIVSVFVALRWRLRCPRLTTSKVPDAPGSGSGSEAALPMECRRPNVGLCSEIAGHFCGVSLRGGNSKPGVVAAEREPVVLIPLAEGLRAPVSFSAVFTEPVSGALSSRFCTSSSSAMRDRRREKMNRIGKTPYASRKSTRPAIPWAVFRRVSDAARLVNYVHLTAHIHSRSL